MANEIELVAVRRYFERTKPRKNIRSLLAITLFMSVYLAVSAGVILKTLSLSAPAPANFIVEAGRPAVVVDCLDITLQQYTADWQVEVARRFPDSVMVIAHGGDAVQGQWAIYPTLSQGVLIETEIRREQAAHPGRTLVILSCNPSHDVLHGFPNVYYAGSSVWLIPDRNYLGGLPDDPHGHLKISETLPSAPPVTMPFFVTQPAAEHEKPTNRSASDPDTVGNIWEFISAE